MRKLFLFFTLLTSFFCSRKKENPKYATVDDLFKIIPAENRFPILLNHHLDSLHELSDSLAIKLFAKKYISYGSYFGCFKIEFNNGFRSLIGLEKYGKTSPVESYFLITIDKNGNRIDKLQVLEFDPILVKGFHLSSDLHVSSIISQDSIIVETVYPGKQKEFLIGVKKYVITSDGKFKEIASEFKK